MNFLKQAQDFAASANVNTDNQGAAAPASGGLGGFMSEAQDMMKSETTPAAAAPAGAPAQSAGAQATVPGGRQAPTNAELMESSKLLFGAAQGQKVDNKKLAGAAEDLLGGLAAHGKLDQGQYGTYVKQAEQYLHKYAGEDQAVKPPASAPAAASAPAPAAASAPAPAAAPAPSAAAASAPAPASGVPAEEAQ